MAWDDLTIDEHSKIKELKSRVNDLLNEKLLADESLFKRFLRARNHDVDAAELMLRNNIQWREVNKIDSILTDFKPHEVTKYIGVQLLGYDKEGSPLFYVPFGKLDTRGILKVIPKKELILYFVQHFEKNIELLKKQSKKINKPVEQFSYIFNYEHFSLSTATHKPTLDFVSNLLQVFDNNYPERLKSAFLVNGSFVFTLFWAVMRPFIAEQTYRKIRIFGKDGWKEEILKGVDADILPGFLGGTRTDPDGDPLCKNTIYHGESVPEHYFPKQCSARIPGSKKLVIHRMAKEEIEFEVKHPGSIIELEFVTKNRDIGFSLFYRESQKAHCERRELIPKQRVETDYSSDSRAFRCEKPGFYVIEFNNSYSWIHSKEIYYAARVISPKTEKISI